MMRTILVFEADVKTAEVFKTQLEKRGYQVFIAHHVTHAKNVLHQTIPDLFLIDLNTADAAFFSFYSRLLSQSELSSVPRLFIEGPAEGEAAKKIREHGSEKILQKPLRLSLLLENIEQAWKGIDPTGIALEKTSMKPTSLSASLVGSSVSGVLSSLIGTQIGSVEIERELGRGGMGAVFLGRQLALDRQVAVKVMLPQLVNQDTALARFRREALAVARLKSPHIVQVFDAGFTEEEVFFLVMEYLDGVTLEEPLEKKGAYSPDEAVRIVAQVCLGLSVAHDAGLLHRDLKPSNLMIDAKGHVTITDFGLVREFGKNDEDGKFTQTGSLLGTPYYLSPEQAAARPLDHRSDLYSLGIVFYELLVGEPPFLSTSLFDLLMMHHQMPLPDPRQKVDGLSEKLIEILNKMTAKRVEDRYSSSLDIYRDLEGLQCSTLARQKKHFNQSCSSKPQSFRDKGHSLQDSLLDYQGVSSIGDSSILDMNLPVGEVLDPALMKQLRIEYARMIGPMAKLKIKKEAGEMGFSHKRFPRERVSDLVDRLASGLTSPKQKEFLAVCSKLFSENEGV